MDFPKKPTQREELLAILYDEFGVARPPQAKTIKEWKREVFLHWFERMGEHMDRALDKQKDKK